MLCRESKIKYHSQKKYINIKIIKISQVIALPKSKKRKIDKFSFILMQNLPKNGKIKKLVRNFLPSTRGKLKKLES